MIHSRGNTSVYNLPVEADANRMIDFKVTLPKFVRGQVVSSIITLANDAGSSESEAIETSEGKNDIVHLLHIVFNTVGT